MPVVNITPQQHSTAADVTSSNPLPKLLQTPGGLAMIELQATINAPLPVEVDDVLMDGSSAQTPVGNIEFPLYDASKPEDMSWMKRVYFYAGKHQRMTGEVKKIAKPLALLKRAEGHDEALEVADIIKYKIVFSQRPEPVSEVT